MNPVGTFNQKSSHKKGYFANKPLWLRVSMWISSGILAILALFAFAAIFVLHTSAFHNYVLKKARTLASEEMGTRVDLQNFTLHLSTLSLDIYGLTVYGANPYSTPPLLQIQHAEAGIHIVSFLQRKWYLDNLRIDGPVAKFFTDVNGNSNLPKLKNSSGSSNTSIFDLGIRHAALTNGEVYYNDKRSVLIADLHDVEFRSAYDATLQKYSGTLSYVDGHLIAGSVQTIPHNLKAEFEATPSAFRLVKTVLASGGSHIAISATMQNYSDPDLQAEYDAVVDGRDLRGMLKNPSVPVGLIHAGGSAHYHAIRNRPAVNAILLNGNLSSPQLDFQTPSLRARINDIAAQYSLANGDATVQSLRARLLGGELDATAKMNAIGGDSHSEVKASLSGISIEGVHSMLRTVEMPKNVALTGTLNSQLNATWGNTINDLVAHADATVDGRISGAGATKRAKTVTPLNAAVHGTYSNASQKLALTNSYVRMPQTSLTMNGLMSKRSNVALRLQSNDLHEVETVAELFRTPAPGKTLRPLGLYGTAAFNGTLGGSTATPHLTGQLLASNLRIYGTEWRVLRTGVDVSPSFAKLENAVLEPASQGRISLNASTGLRKWSFTEASPVQINLKASQLSITDLTKATGAQVPVTGLLTANVNMHGTELHPIGEGTLSLSHLIAYNEPVRSVQLVFSGTGDEVHGNLEISLPAGRMQSTMSVRPREKSYIAQVTANDIRLEKLDSLKARNLDVDGGVTLHANGKGTLDNPQLDATLQIPELMVQKQAIRSLNLQMNVANHLAAANLTSQVINTSIRGNAKINLTGDYLADATLDTQAIPLQPLAAIYAPEQADALSGETELHATLHGPLKNKQLLEGHLIVPMLRVGYGKDVQLAAASPIRVDLKDSILSLQRGAIRGTETDLQFQGSIPTTGNAPMSLLLVGTVNLRLAQLLNPELICSGQLKFNIDSYGAAHDPNVQGKIEIVDASIATGDLPVGMQHGNGVLTLTKDRLNISKFEGIVGSGVVNAQGGVVYRPNLQFDLGLSGKDIRLLYPQGVRESVNGNVRLAGTPESAVLGGAVDLTDLSFTPAFDLTNFIDQFSGGVSAPPTRGISQNIQLNLAVRSANNLSLTSRTLSINGRANLQVRGTASQPVILGRVNLDGGDLIFNGDRFILNGGTIQFVNPSQTQPVVNLALNTTIREYSINMRFNGPLDQLHTEYASDPALPAADIINLLAFGKTTEANASDPSTPANQQAATLVASQVSSQVTSRLAKVAGISQLSINPVLSGGSNQGPAGANVTIQQRVTGNLFVTFSSNLASTQNQTIMGQYQVTPRVTLSFTRDQNGGFAVDTTIKKTW